MGWRPELDPNRRVFDESRGPMDMESTYARSGVIGALMVFAILGAVLGTAMANIFAPELTLAFSLGGAMSCAAVAVAVVLMRTAEKHKPIDEYASGFARTEEEVRQALAKIEAKRK